MLWRLPFLDSVTLLCYRVEGWYTFFKGCSTLNQGVRMTPCLNVQSWKKIEINEEVLPLKWKGCVSHFFMLLESDFTGAVWVGGKRGAENEWYWTGILTGRVPEQYSAESSWHEGHSEDSNIGCLSIYLSSGDVRSSGLDAHWQCEDSYKFICEKPFTP